MADVSARALEPSPLGLRDFPLFAGLSAEDADLLQQSIGCRHFPAGARVFDEGDPASGFYMVRKGSVKIFKISPRGQEQVLTVASAGGSFGEAAIFTGHGLSCGRGMLAGQRADLHRAADAGAVVVSRSGNGPANDGGHVPQVAPTGLDGFCE